MRRLYYAVVAFITIIRGKNHLYCDQNVKSVRGTKKVFFEFRNDLTEMVGSHESEHKKVA